MQRANLLFKSEVPLYEFAAAFVINFAFGRERKGPLGAIQQLRAQALLQLVDTWLRPIAKCRFLRAREKPCRPTTSQKILRLLKCMKWTRWRPLDWPAG